jgi:hypothetical protein
MQPIFSFFFRLLFAFLAAKFLARFFGLESLAPLLGLTLLFLGNIYLFDYLDYRSHTAWRRSQGLSRPKSGLPAAAPPPEETREV